MSHDDAARRRLERLNDPEGMWRCRTIFNCAGQVTRAIGEVKKAILYGTTRA